MGEAEDLSEKGPEELKKDIEKTRASLSEKLDSLGTEVSETVKEATNSAEKMVSNVKASFSLRHQVQVHPWPLFFTSVVVGFGTGVYLGRSQLKSPKSGEPRAQTPLYTSRNRGSGRKSSFAQLTDYFEEEIRGLKAIAIGTLVGALRDIAKDAAPTSLANKVGEVADRATEKLGGHPVPGRVFDAKWNGSSRSTGVS